MRDDEIVAAWVEGPPPEFAPVVLVEYNPEWPVLFEREAGRLRDVLGDAAVSVEHVGSTSVPGLLAKPIIDVNLAVDDSSDEAAYVPALIAAGYRLVVREPDWHEHRCFKGPDTNINLHVFTAGSEELARMRMFRDWLRTNDDDRELYAGTKRDLATKEWKYIQHYADAKGEVIEAIIARASSNLG